MAVCLRVFVGMKSGLATPLISTATQRNWVRLRSGDNGANTRLVMRANKRLSQKRFVPKESVTCLHNLPVISDILDFIGAQNRSVPHVVRALCVGVLTEYSADFADNHHVQQFIAELNVAANDPLVGIALPADEADILGVIYQCLLCEGSKNTSGSYFTPAPIVATLTSDIPAAAQSTFLDPCCGTGRFLSSIKNANPRNLFGIDIDPLAVMIAKTNLFVQFRHELFAPNIHCADFLSFGHNLFHSAPVPCKVDYIISNPPWGAQMPEHYRTFYPQVHSGESFSYFITQSLAFLKYGGELRFVLPESILNVRVHQDIRRVILEQTTLESLHLFARQFAGVFTPVVGLRLTNNSSTESSTVRIESATEIRTCPQSDYRRNDHFVFAITDDTDRAILAAMHRAPYHTLCSSRWALGIVTGDNKGKIHAITQEGMEPVYTGKDVRQYALNPATSHVRYERENFQQVAPDALYRAPEKLVYKFISSRLVFAYDNSGALLLNSANVLIPNVPGYSIKAVAALLNSTAMQYLYLKKFGEIKILRGNLEKLPLPEISLALNKHLGELVDRILAGNSGAHGQIQSLVYECFGLTKTQIHHIESVANG